MAAIKIVNHEPVTPAVGQVWYAYHNGEILEVIKMQGNHHIVVADLTSLPPNTSKALAIARRKTLTREGFLRRFREGAKVWLTPGARERY